MYLIIAHFVFGYKFGFELDFVVGFVFNGLLFDNVLVDIFLDSIVWVKDRCCLSLDSFVLFLLLYDAAQLWLQNFFVSWSRLWTENPLLQFRQIFAGKLTYEDPISKYVLWDSLDSKLGFLKGQLQNYHLYLYLTYAFICNIITWSRFGRMVDQPLDRPIKYRKLEVRIFSVPPFLCLQYVQAEVIYRYMRGWLRREALGW